jgi:DNA-binding CsgD family transcriptional regulator
MNHIMLLGYFLALMVGVAAFVTSQQFYRLYKPPFLRYLGYYIVFLNTALFIYFVTGYLSVNFPSPQFEDPDSVLHAILYILASLVWLGCIHFFIHLVFGLHGAEVSRSVSRVFYIGLIVVGVVCVIGITTYIHTGSNGWNLGIYLGLMAAAVLILISGMISLLLRRGREPGDLGPIKAFGWLHLAAYVGFFSAPFLPLPFKIITLFAAVIGVNLVPILWLRIFFLRSPIRFSPDRNLPSLDLLARKYQISAREREVMELVLKGKSNQEIEKALFISYNTVKNHIYSIYRKLDVRSRGQMIHFVHRALKLEGASGDHGPTPAT